jgi:hypothetical protein
VGAISAKGAATAFLIGIQSNSSVGNILAISGIPYFPDPLRTFIVNSEVRGIEILADLRDSSLPTGPQTLLISVDARSESIAIDGRVEVIASSSNIFYVTDSVVKLTAIA